MLASLRISNFALIDEVELDFQSGYTVLTGETGSGKLENRFYYMPYNLF